MNIRRGFLKKAFSGLQRLFPSYILCFVPFLVFGTWSDIRLLLWKVALVGAGLVVFHFARKSMFPYIDLNLAIGAAVSADQRDRLAMAVIALAEAALVSAMAFAVIFSIAGGI